MRRAVTGFLVIIAAVLVLLTVAAGFLLLTEPGLKFLHKRLEHLTGSALVIEAVHGRLAGPVRITGLRYEDATNRFAAQEINLDWKPRALLAGTLHIASVEIRGLRYAKQPDTLPGPKEALVLPARVMLPVSIRVDALRIEDAELLITPDATPIVVQEASLRAKYTGINLDLEAIALKAPQLTLEGSLELDTLGDYPLQGDAHWTASADDMAPLEGHTQLAGTLRQLELTQELAPPYALHAALGLDNPLGNPTLTGTLTLHETDLARINSNWPALRLNGSLQAEGPPERLQLAGSITGKGMEPGSVKATLDGELQPETLLLRSLVLALTDQPDRLELQGNIGFATPETRLELRVNWESLDWPLQGIPRVSSKQGTLTLAGSLEAYTLTGDAALDVPGYSSGGIRLQGRGDLQSLELNELELSAAEGTLQGTGQVQWAPQLSATLALSGTALNPAVLWPDWPGKLDLQLQAQLAGEADQRTVRFDTVTANGSLRGQPLHADARGHYRPGEWALEKVELHSGTTQLSAQGMVGKTLNLAWKIDSPDLSALAPDAAGQLSGSGEAHGTLNDLQLTAILEGSELLYRSERINAFKLDAALDLGGQTASKLDLSLRNALLKGVVLRNLKLDGNGTPATHRLTLAAETNRGKVDLAADGSWDHTTWAGQLARADLAWPGLAPWQLATPATGRISATRTELTEACWRSADASLCLNAVRTDQDLSAAFRLSSLPLAYFAGLLPTEIDLQGSADAEGEIRQRTGRPLLASAKLTTTAGTLAVPESGGEQRRELLGFDAGTVTAELDDNGARLNARLPLKEGQGILAARVQLTATNPEWPARRLDGELTAKLPDIAFLGKLLPEVSSLHGRVDGNARLSGSLAAPRLQGSLLLADGGATLDTPGLVLDEVHIELTGQPNGEIRLDARTRSGGGLLTASGQVNLSAPQESGRLQLRGDSVQILNTPEAEVYASPDLRIALAGTRIDVTGEVRVPRAAIHPRKLPKSAVTVSSDQVIIGGEQAVARPARYQIHSSVRFLLGEKIEFEGLGLTGNLGGNLLAVDEPGRPTRATGELNITDGKYKAYGQDLDIRLGRLLFAGGPITEPGLDIEAVRRPAPDILAGVKVRGSLRTPKLTLFSEPSMPQSEQLSWLVLGRSSEGASSDSERSSLNQAAIMLGLSGSGLLGKELEDRLGVDEISVSSGSGSDTTQASLLVGKYLTPKLFVSYGIGLFEPLSTLRLNYTLSSRWRLVSETSGAGSSADLFYVIEQGK